MNQKLWLQREAEAQEEFARKKLEEERKIKQKEEQEVSSIVVALYFKFILKKSLD